MLAGRLLLLCLLLASLPGGEAQIFTDEEWSHAQPATGAAMAAPSPSSTIGSVVLSLAAVAALAVGLGWAVRRLGVKRILPGRGRHLEVLESVPLAFKRQVSLVRIGDQVLVVGVGEHELHALATLPAASVLGAEPPPAPPAAPPPVAGPFQQTLARLLGRRG